MAEDNRALLEALQEVEAAKSQAGEGRGFRSGARGQTVGPEQLIQQQQTEIPLELFDEIGVARPGQPSEVPIIESFLRGLGEAGAVVQPLANVLGDVGAVAGTRTAEFFNNLPAAPTSEIISKERERAAQSAAQNRVATGFGNLIGYGAGPAGAATSAIEKGLARGAASVFPGMATKAVPRFLGQAAARTSAGTGVGILSDVGEGRVQSFQEFKDSVATNGLQNLAVEGVLSTALGVKAGLKKGTKLASPTLRRIEGSGEFFPEQQITKGDVAAARPVAGKRDPLVEASEELAGAVETIQTEGMRKAGALGEKAQVAVREAKGGLSQKYREMTQPIINQYGNMRVNSAPLYEDLTEMMIERGIIKQVSNRGGTKWVMDSKTGQQALGPAFAPLRDLFERMGGTKVYNGEQKAIKNLTLQELRAERLNLKKFTEFGAINTGADSAAANRVWKKVGSVMENEFTDFAAANKLYNEGMDQIETVDSLLRNSDLKPQKLIALDDPKNVNALDAISNLGKWAQANGIKSSVSGLPKEIGDMAGELALINKIAKKADPQNVERLFLNLGQSERQAIADAAQKYPQLLPMSKRANAAAEARRLWGEAAEEAGPTPLGMERVARGKLPMISLPDKTIAKIAVWAEQSPKYAKMLFNIPDKVLKSTRPRVATILWLRSPDGQERLAEAYENPQWLNQQQEQQQ